MSRGGRMNYGKRFNGSSTSIGFTRLVGLAARGVKLSKRKRIFTSGKTSAKRRLRDHKPTLAKIEF